ncbi:hypothetical protein HYV49_03950 [Candidatus Pacearchaeota archaeon]|nr:hypothetical protein [Candidatus Pacearchaeota archaeon]
MKLLPQQIELWYIIPAIRREFAIEMAKQGMKAVEIANTLGITKSAVSQYFNKMRAVEFRFGNDIKNEIKKSVEIIKKGQESGEEIQRIINILRENRSICKFHHIKEKLDKGCEICFR